LIQLRSDLLSFVLYSLSFAEVSKWFFDFCSAGVTRFLASSLNLYIYICYTIFPSVGVFDVLSGHGYSMLFMFVLVAVVNNSILFFCGWSQEDDNHSICGRNTFK
jgi:hypothetical protein